MTFCDCLEYKWKHLDCKDPLFRVCVCQEEGLERAQKEYIDTMERQLYASKARKILEIMRNKWFEDIPRYHDIDHCFSLHNGYSKKVPLAVISNRNNLQVMPHMFNVAKGTQNSITLEQLYETCIEDEEVSALVALLEPLDNMTSVQRFTLPATT